MVGDAGYTGNLDAAGPRHDDLEAGAADGLQHHPGNACRDACIQPHVPGQEVSIVLKAYPDAPLTGTVLRIGPQATGLVGDAATFPVIIELDAANLDLRPGMTGRAEIRGGS